jgi:hypothetical protein
MEEEQLANGAWDSHLCLSQYRAPRTTCTVGSQLQFMMRLQGCAQEDLAQAAVLIFPFAELKFLKLAGFCFFAKVERKQQVGLLGPSPLPSMSGGCDHCFHPKEFGNLLGKKYLEQIEVFTYILLELIYVNYPFKFELSKNK